MSANSDFVIENGVLLEYKGPGGEVIIPEGVTEIPILRFEHCNHLTRVVLPESLQSINIRAFYDCINLKEVVISKNVSYIGEGAFDSCERLERIIYLADEREVRGKYVRGNELFFYGYNI